MKRLKSKSIEDYFQARLSELRVGVLPFDIYLYFSQSFHVVMWKKAADFLTDGWLDKYRARGLEKIWIHRDDAGIFARYRAGEAMNEIPADRVIDDAEATLAATAPEAEPEQAIAPDTEEHAETTVAGASEEPPQETVVAATQEIEPAEVAPEAKKILEAMKDNGLTTKEKKLEVSAQAKTLVAAAASARTAEEQEAAHARNRQIIKDIMDDIGGEVESLVSEIWRLADIDPDLEHAVNVATYSVIFAMAFGRIDRNLIADLALAGLLHDIGICQLPADLAQKPWKSMSREELFAYSQHVELGLEIIRQFAPALPERVKTIIHQHHEKFDGSGYPKRLQGFKVDDIAQLMAIADLLDSISSGQWDGVIRTVKATFELVEKVESSRTFPEHFNPDVFAVVVRWTRTTEADASTHETAIDTVKNQTLRLFKESRNDPKPREAKAPAA